jgi:hypothetical protein
MLLEQIKEDAIGRTRRMYEKEEASGNAKVISLS